MRVAYDEAISWIVDFGVANTGKGSAGTNTVKFSIRTTADAAVTSYDWTNGVLELAGAQGQYLILIPASVFNAAGRYVLAARTADAGGVWLYEELIIVAPHATAAALSTVAGYVDTEVAAIKAKTDNLPASPAATSDIPSAATVASTVWNELLSGHSTNGSAGQRLEDTYLGEGQLGDDIQGVLDAVTDVRNNLLTVADIWNAVTSGLTVAGSIGKLLVDKIDQTISSRASQTTVDTLAGYVDTEVAAIKAKTDALPDIQATA